MVLIETFIFIKHTIAKQAAFKRSVLLSEKTADVQHIVHLPFLFKK